VAEEARDSSKTDLDLAREDLSLAVDRGQPTDGLEENYRTTQETYDAALVEAETAKAAADKADAAAQKAEKSQADRAANGSDWRQWLSAALRLALIGALTIGGLRLINRLRLRDSRYLPLGFAVTASGVIMAFVFAVDYIDILDLGPIVLSVAGMAATFGAFIGLQKYLARRIPRSRVRKANVPSAASPSGPTRARTAKGVDVRSSRAAEVARARAGLAPLTARGAEQPEEPNRLASIAGQAAVGDAVGPGCVGAESLDLVLLV